MGACCSYQGACGWPCAAGWVAVLSAGTTGGSHQGTCTWLCLCVGEQQCTQVGGRTVCRVIAQVHSHAPSTLSQPVAYPLLACSQVTTFLIVACSAVLWGMSMMNRTSAQCRQDIPWHQHEKGLTGSRTCTPLTDSLAGDRKGTQDPCPKFAGVLCIGTENGSYAHDPAPPDRQPCW